MGAAGRVREERGTLLGSPLLPPVVVVVFWLVVASWLAPACGAVVVNDNTTPDVAVSQSTRKASTNVNETCLYYTNLIGSLAVTRQMTNTSTQLIVDVPSVGLEPIGIEIVDDIVYLATFEDIIAYSLPALTDPKPTGDVFYDVFNSNFFQGICSPAILRSSGNLMYVACLDTQGTNFDLITLFLTASAYGEWVVLLFYSPAWVC